MVLSACETGIGKLQKGEGAMSIARAFQYAGAENILFSLWKINDYAAAQLMTNFYKNFEKTNSFFESNYLSKIDYLKMNKFLMPKNLLIIGVRLCIMELLILKQIIIFIICFLEEL